MSLKTTQWYASRAAMERDDVPSAELVKTYTGYQLRWFLTLFHSRLGLGGHFRVEVTDRSLAHIDRLARDWIGHGVGPTKSGGRGARKWSARGRGWEQILASWPRFTQAERRARRVVRTP
jgi:hypothetical protein